MLSVLYVVLVTCPLVVVSPCNARKRASKRLTVKIKRFIEANATRNSDELPSGIASGAVGRVVGVVAALLLLRRGGTRSGIGGIPGGAWSAIQNIIGGSRRTRYASDGRQNANETVGTIGHVGSEGGDGEKRE